MCQLISNKQSDSSSNRKFQPFTSERLLTHYHINIIIFPVCLLYINTKDFVWRRVCSVCGVLNISAHLALLLLLTYYWFGGALPCQSELIVQYNIGGNLGLNKCHFIPIRTGNCHHVLQQISINSTVRWEIQQDLYI